MSEADMAKNTKQAEHNDDFLRKLGIDPVGFVHAAPSTEDAAKLRRDIKLKLGPCDVLYKEDGAKKR
jgi:hypothetical protein